MQTLNCILLIDDDPVTNYLHQDLINSLTITEQVLTAKNGEEGLKLAEKGCECGESPAIILVDLNMPVLDGFGFLTAYKQALKLSSSSVVAVLTSSINPKDVTRVAELNVAPMLTKPLQAEHLYSLAQTYWQRKGEQSDQ